MRGCCATLELFRLAAMRQLTGSEKSGIVVLNLLVVGVGFGMKWPSCAVFSVAPPHAGSWRCDALLLLLRCWWLVSESEKRQEPKEGWVREQMGCWCLRRRHAYVLT